jgi:plastocyanin
MKVLARRATPVLVLALLLAAAGCGGSNKSQASGLDTSYRAPDPYSLQSLEQQPYSCAKNNEQCAIAYLTKITKQHGPQASLGVLGSLEQSGRINPAFDTHQLAHLLGQATAEQFGANKRAFGLCPNSFNYGCVHGFFIYVLGHTSTPSKAASVICNSANPGGPLVPTFSCWHGVGHGVMMARGNDLKASLDVCNTLGSASAADGCWQGVFMENVNAEMRHQARPGVFSKSQPLRPCTRVLAEYRHECFINQAGWLAYLAHDDIGKATRFCLDASGAYKSVCAQSIGLMVTNPSWQDAFVGAPQGQSFEQIAWTLCTRFPASLRKDCVIGGVDNLANFDQLDVTRSNRFCALTEPTLKRTCYREIGVNLARRTTDLAVARSSCDPIQGKHRSECVAGVTQGALPVKPIVVPKTQSQSQAQPSNKKASATVHMTAAGFSPSVVTIRQGQTVKFVNDSGQGYWPASNPHPIHTDYPGFDAGNTVQPGGSWSFTFDRVGRWGYHNHLSPETKGTIVVTSAS